MRKELGLYANIRPIKLFDELLSASSIKPEILKGADILFFRELTGDLYFGEKGRKNNGDGGGRFFNELHLSRGQTGRTDDHIDAVFLACPQMLERRLRSCKFN